MIFDDFHMKIKVHHNHITLDHTELPRQNRASVVADWLKDELVLGYKELCQLVDEDVFENEETVIVKYSENEMRMIYLSSVVQFFVNSSPSSEKSTFYRRAVIPVPKRVQYELEAEILFKHLILSSKKESMFFSFIFERTSGIQNIPMRKILTDGDWSDLEMSESEGEFPSGLNRRARTGYMIAALLHEKFPERADFWFQETVKHVDPDLAQLELIVAQDQEFLYANLIKEDDLTRNSEYLQQRINALEAEKVALQVQYETDISLMLEFIEAYQKQRNQPDVAPQSKFLFGKKICVVGDEARQPFYRAIVEMEGADFVFLPGFDKDGEASQQLKVADGVIFITAYSNHGKFYALKASRTLERVVMVDRRGVQSFCDGMEELKQKFVEASGEVATSKA